MSVISNSATVKCKRQTAVTAHFTSEQYCSLPFLGSTNTRGVIPGVPTRPVTASRSGVSAVSESMTLIATPGRKPPSGGKRLECTSLEAKGHGGTLK